MKFRSRLFGLLAVTAIIAGPLAAPASAGTLVTSRATEDWALDVLDNRVGEIDGSYDYSTGEAGQGVTMYIVDSGIDNKHSEFAGREIRGADFVGDGHDWTDCAGHGTSVASAAAGNTLGVAPKVDLVAVRVFDCKAKMPSFDVIFAALDWILKDYVPGTPAVVNMSLGSGIVAAQDIAVQKLIDAGMTVVTSAGNTSGDACKRSPAHMPAVLTVGNAYSVDTLSPSPDSSFGTCVDLYAPGTDVPTALLGLNEKTITWSNGTSYAAPLVAGAAARYLTAVPAATPAQVHDFITSTATKDLVVDVQPNTPNKFLFIYSGSLLTPDGIPSAPRGLEVTPDVNSAYLFWMTPQFSGMFTNVTNYVATATPVKGGKSVTQSFVYDIFGDNEMTGLTAGVTYRLSMHAVNSFGAGPDMVSSPFTVPTHASAPRALTVRVLSAQSLKVAWAAPAHLGWSALTGYSYRTSLDGATGKKWSKWKKVGKATSVTLTNLTPGAVRMVQVRAQTVVTDGLIASVLARTPKN